MHRFLKQQGESRERRDQLIIRLPEAGVAGHRSQSALELGHHQAAGAGPMDLLLPLRDPGCLQPLRYRLDGRASRECRSGQAADRGELRETKHRPGQLTLHADRGTSMSSKPVAFLLADLVSRKPTAARTSPMTIRIRKASFAP